ncbi:MAG: hypothetical protein IPM61_01120 [Chlorobi bacterium]|nr:hypothetical protein [Chlorobiota bacterium]
MQYLLGGSKEQLAVWHGQQMSGPFCDTAWRRNVFLYPTEYLTNGIGWNGVHEDLTPIITAPDGSKEYRISDHLASLRASLTPGISTKYYDYDPWGNVLGGGTAARRGFNENEKDRENGLFSLGVRKYEEGRFLSIDPLFEKEAEISPYVYAGNAPLNFSDPGGKQRDKFLMRTPMGFFGVEVAMGAGSGMSGSGGVMTEPDGQSSGKFGSVGLRPSSMEHSSGARYSKVGSVPQPFLQSSRGGVAAGAQSAQSPKTYQTYTKTNPTTNQVYSGRTSGTGTPEKNVAKRDANHHMNKKGYDPAEVERSSTNKEAIRGREQQLIEKHGGAQSQGGTSGNAINGISPNNPSGSRYLQQAIQEFGPL